MEPQTETSKTKGRPLFERGQMMEQIRALNVAIVGGGPGCKAIMDMIFAEKLSQLQMKLIGVACTNPEAVGYRYAREKGIYTTRDYRDLYKLKDLNMIIELTGREQIANEIFETIPHHVRVMDHVAARLFWDVFQIEEERIAERKQTEGELRKHRDHLDELVKERTAELITANEQLQREIVERKQQQEQVKQKTEFLNLILESLPHPFCVIDASDYTIRVANSAAHMGRLSKNITCHAFLHKSTRPCGTERHPCPLEIVKQTKQPVTIEHLHYDKDGDPRNVEIHAYPIYDSEGNVSQMIESSLDVTERKRAEEEREKLIEELQNALAKVKTLSGLLPICSSCKKIRDDKGYWNQIEAYIRDHSEAEFSHSICPECVKELYPGLYETGRLEIDRRRYSPDEQISTGMMGHDQRSGLERRSGKERRTAAA